MNFADSAVWSIFSSKASQVYVIMVYNSNYLRKNRQYPFFPKKEEMESIIIP